MIVYIFYDNHIDIGELETRNLQSRIFKHKLVYLNCPNLS